MFFCKSGLAVATALFVWLFCQISYGAQTGTWDMSKDGKYWMYFYSPGSPARDEWIEEGGKEYYVDSGGRMKTGWVTDKRDGSKYYMGGDGAKCVNTFTPDGHYVGKDGTVLNSFDTYRSAVRKQLNHLMKDKSYQKREGADLPGFILMDLNGDGYRDVVVMDHMQSPSRVIMAALWDPDEEKLNVAAEADPQGKENSHLMYNQETQSLWLTISGSDGHKDYFKLEAGGFQFENIWNFDTRCNDWGEIEYYVNHVKAEPNEWQDALAQADKELGAALESGLCALNEETVENSVNQMPDGEISLWE